MRQGAGLALCALFCLIASTPPALLPGAEWLVLPGWAALYALTSSATRPKLWGYLIGVVHIWVFSWSLRHVSVGGLAAIGLAGGCYYVLLVAYARWGARYGLGGLMFGVGLAAMHWLRAHIPQIYYPHGQPIHALYEWPLLLEPLRFGGEVWMNLLIGWVAAGIVDSWRAWRTAMPSRRAAASLLSLGLGSWILTGLLGAAFVPVDWRPESVRVAAVQPGPFGDLPDRQAFYDWVQRQLMQPSLEMAGPGVEAPPALVLWPESTWPQWLQGDPPTLQPRFRFPPLAEGVQILAGRAYLRPDGSRVGAAFQMDHRGRLIDWHEKQRPVAAGERIPFIGWLPADWKKGLLEWAAGMTQIESLPDMSAGDYRPPLSTASGTRFAVLTCFDNTFDELGRRAVGDGAQLICVLSNENWYQGGAELDQMTAMSVCRTIETATPMIRSTIDGPTLAIDADGRVLAALPRGPGPQTLQIDLIKGAGRALPMAWLPGVLGWITALSGLLLLWRRRSAGRLGASSSPDQASA